MCLREPWRATFPSRDHRRAGRPPAHPPEGLAPHDRRVDDHVPPRHRGARPLHPRELLDPRAPRRGCCAATPRPTCASPSWPRARSRRPSPSWVRSPSEFLVFADPDRVAVKAFGLESLPAFVHVNQHHQVEADGRGLDPRGLEARGREPLGPHGLDRSGHPRRRRPVAVRRHARRRLTREAATDGCRPWSCRPRRGPGRARRAPSASRSSTRSRMLRPVRTDSFTSSAAFS